MWVDKFKEIITLKKIKLDDIASSIGMSRTGFRQGLDAGSLRFDTMSKILSYYNINYYELVEEDYSIVSEKIGYYENSNKSKQDFTKIIQTLKENYEDRIKKADEHNELLKGQILFLQQLISKNIGLGETQSHVG